MKITYKKYRKSRNTFIIAIVIFLSFVASGFAQMKVDSLGRVLVGTPYTPHDGYGVTNMSVFGNYGVYRAGAKLSFGDFGKRNHNGWNVFVGEYDTIDSDKLWLHGKRGFHISVGNGFELASYDYKYSLSFPWENNYVRERSINVRTTITAKKHLTYFGNKNMSQPDDMTGSLTQIMQLSPITYTYHMPISDFGTDIPDVPSINSIPTENITEKTRMDIAEDSALRSELTAEGFNFGLGLESFEAQFPTLVSIDEEGNKYIDYVSLVPVLVSSIQEQQQIIESQNAIIEDIRTQMYNMQDTLHQLVLRRDSLATATNSHLDQNIPNPFDDETTIGYYVSPDAEYATIYIFNMTGVLVQTFVIQQFGIGSVDLSASNLNAGMYVYTLVVDGNVADSKRMIISE